MVTVPLRNTQDQRHNDDVKNACSYPIDHETTPFAIPEKLEIPFIFGVAKMMPRPYENGTSRYLWSLSHESKGKNLFRSNLHTLRDDFHTQKNGC